ncbi:hypothetical protein LPW26_03345 [Rhodopseudomonas sp. HC1]|uniref:hypothetical protein n=1 Tax=Rhodopseudomonas infernalis TaxID=2897386 RepID=UPI001EE7A989|nr:hypothetical protein [Rhodopseudomonas infernalis]MCG6203661.1 hypothetical protein [Rhodopseudomonas infernalis]
MRPTKWTPDELKLLPDLAKRDASNAELIAALPRHRLSTIKARIYAAGLRRPSAVRKSVRERQRARMELANGYVMRRRAELNGADLSSTVNRLAAAAAIECIAYAATNLAPAPHRSREDDRTAPPAGNIQAMES